MLGPSRDARARISVLVSGGGSNLQALLDAQASGTLRSGRVVQVVSSRADARALSEEAVQILHELPGENRFLEELILQLVDRRY